MEMEKIASLFESNNRLYQHLHELADTALVE